jgi:multidrug resistance efflux pump
LHVRDGQSVHRGQLLLSVDDKPTKSAIAAAVAAEAQAKAEMRALDGQWHTAAVHAQRLSAAATDGAGDRQSAEDGTASAANVAAQLEAAKANLRMAEVRTREARRQWHLTKLRSPTDGQIIAIAGREGTTVTPEMSVVTLLPASPLIVRAELETQQVETIAFGMPAIVTDEDTGATLTTASVDRVGVIAGASTLISDPQRRSAIRTVECILKLPATTHLRVGQRVVVRFPRQPVPAQH